MINKKNIILAFGNKEFNSSLFELKNYFNFNLKIVDNLEEDSSIDQYQGLIIHEDALKDKKIIDIINSKTINKIIFYNSNEVKGLEKIDKLLLPASVDQINKIILNNIVKKKFKTNSSLKINDYNLDKNSRRLTKNNIFLELTEKEIELVELLNKETFIKKKEILSIIWKY